MDSKFESKFGTIRLEQGAVDWEQPGAGARDQGVGPETRFLGKDD